MVNFNLGDVLGVLSAVKAHLIAIGIVILSMIVLIVALRKMDLAKKKLMRGESVIGGVLIIVIIVNMICMGPMNSLLTLASGEGTISQDSMDAALEANVEIAGEGMVLLKNADQALPLEQGTKLNVFGWSSTNPIYSGTGAGSINSNYDTVSILEGLEQAGFELNDELTKFYTDFRDTRPSVSYWGQDWTIPEPSMEEYDAANIFEDAKAFSDTALVVLSRTGGEGADLPTSYDAEDTYSETGGGFGGASGVRMSEYPDDLDASKHYLEISNRESEMIDRVASEFSKVIVVVNSANVMELGFVDQYDSIKGVIWAPGAGQAGFTALGQILNGTVNPSAKTADTFVYDLTATPTFNNFGLFEYENMTEFGHIDDLSPNVEYVPSFVNYVENIYVGYKYYETAAAEGVIDYESTVQYPFGYGLSYTEFSQKMSEITEADGTLTFDVTVTNTGTTAGKDVVEVYYNPPYVNGGIEKASANLIDYAKTDVLEPGESQVITISIAVEDMASFDTYGEGCYVLEAGDYEISINSDSHNKIASGIYHVDEDIVYNEGNERASDEEVAVTKLGAVEGNFTYLSRADHFANYEEATAAPTDYVLPEDKKAAFLNNSNYNPEDYNNSDDEMPVTGADNGIELADLRGADYDDEMWDQLLDQLTVEEMDALIAEAGYQTVRAESVGKVNTVDCDGAAAINNNFTGQGSIGFPAAVMIACTWNKDLGVLFGQNIGRMADEMNVSGWYAPSMNMHRSAFAGRNFEYYSEDGVLAGYMAASALSGAKEYGIYGYIKHFALNDQETVRYGQLCTWASEQAIREIYLKPFELAVKEGGADAVMSSYNHIGIEPAGACSAVLNGILRDEWGFRGMVLSDYFVDFGFMDSDRYIRNGTDAMLADYDTGTNHLTDTESATSIKAMRQACKNQLYTVVNSRAYADDNIHMGMHKWQKIMVAADVVVVLVLVAGEVVLIRNYRKRTNAVEKVKK